MRILKIGARGNDVRKWQYFLAGQGLYKNVVDGEFGEITKESSVAFQKQHGLQPDGIVGNKTVGIAMTLGFGLLTDNRTSKVSINWPLNPVSNLLYQMHNDLLFLGASNSDTNLW